MKNSLYEGNVLHHRLSPKKHLFNYRVNYFFLNLDKPEKIITFGPFLSFNAKNYLNSMEVRDALTKEFGSESKDVKDIFILTQLTYFGFCFNPVSFYYCYGEDNKLLYVLSLITNTPWGEKHLDVFDFQKTTGEMNFPKNFHVSPFMPMEINYKWIFNSPDSTVRIKMLNHHYNESKHFFIAEMNLRSKEYNRKNVLINLIRYPLMTFKTVLGIYWQALLLFMKKIPFHTHPKKREAL